MQSSIYRFELDFGFHVFSIQFFSHSAAYSTFDQLHSHIVCVSTGNAWL